MKNESMRFFAIYVENGRNWEIIMIKGIFILYTIACILITIFITYNIAKRRGKIISVISIINVWFVIDVCVPAIDVAFMGRSSNVPYYMGSIGVESFYLAMIFHSFAIVLFWIFYLGKGKKVDFNKRTLELSVRQVHKAEKLLILFLLIQIIGQFNDITASGGLREYYNFKIARIYAVGISYSNPARRLFGLFSQSVLTPSMILTVLYMFKGKNIIKKIAYFIITLAFVLISLYRGTLVNLFFMILVLYEENERNLSFNKKIRRIFCIGAVIVFTFFIYSGIRSILNARYWGVEEGDFRIITSSITALRATLGNTLLGTARCIQYLLNDGKPFMGLSIYELLYRFIPRAIWKTKPRLYGMQTISMAMGTPASTMDALSLLGELIINFNFFGLFLIPIYGWLAHRFEEFRFDTLKVLLYAAMLFPFCTMAMWMGNTGIMSNILSMFLYYIFLKGIRTKQGIRKNNNA